MSPFQLKKFDSAKLDVLETKFTMYEDLSRQMMDKLEIAVDKISDSNNKIATILSKHDERIDQTIRNDEHFSKQLDQLKSDNKEDHKNVIKRLDGLEVKVQEKFDGLEVKVQDLIKIRWIFAGVLLIVAFVFTQSSFVVDILTPEQQPNYKIETKN